MLYSSLLAKPTLRQHDYMNMWATDLDNTIEPEQWTQIWNPTKLSSQNVLALQTDCNVLNSWYFIPTCLAHFILGQTGCCFLGYDIPGTYEHTWWSCLIVCTLWTQIYNILATMFNIAIPMLLGEALLNLKPNGLIKHESLI